MLNPEAKPGTGKSSRRRTPSVDAGGAGGSGSGGRGDSKRRGRSKKSGLSRAGAANRGLTDLNNPLEGGSGQQGLGPPGLLDIYPGPDGAPGGPFQQHHFQPFPPDLRRNGGLEFHHGQPGHHLVGPGPPPPGLPNGGRLSPSAMRPSPLEGGPGAPFGYPQEWSPEFGHCGMHGYFPGEILCNCKREDNAFCDLKVREVTWKRAAKDRRATSLAGSSLHRRG